MNERMEQLKDITFSEWQPKDKYWLLTLVESQEQELTAANAEIERLLREGRSACDAWNEALTATNAKVEKLKRKVFSILNHSQSGIDGPYIEEAIRQAIADSEEA